MTDFEVSLRSALAAVPHPGHRERMLQRHLDRPDSIPRGRWLNRCKSAVLDAMPFDHPSILQWLSDHWLECLQAFLSLAALILPFLLASTDEHAMMHSEVNATVEDAMASGWFPGEEIIKALLPRIILPVRLAHGPADCQRLAGADHLRRRPTEGVPVGEVSGGAAMTYQLWVRQEGGGWSLVDFFGSREEARKVLLEMHSIWDWKIIECQQAN